MYQWIPLTLPSLLLLARFMSLPEASEPGPQAAAGQAYSLPATPSPAQRTNAGTAVLPVPMPVLTMSCFGQHE